MTVPDALLRDLLDGMPESVSLYDLEARVVYANPAAERYFGRALAELSGQRLWDLFPDTVGNPFHAAFQRVAAGGGREELEHFYAPWGIWFSNRLERRGAHVHVVLSDVTEKRRRREETDGLRQLLESLSDALPALVAFVDKQEVYRYVNASCEAWVGLARDQFVGRRIADVVGPAGYERLRGHIQAALAGTRADFRMRFDYPTGARDIRAHYVPIRDGSAEVAGFAVLALDVGHETRLAEAERARFEAQRAATFRLERLLAVAGHLATAQNEADVGLAVVDAGVDALGAEMAGMWLLAPDEQELRLVRARGFDPVDEAGFARIPLAMRGAVTDAVRTRAPVWMSSRAEYLAAYPEVAARLGDKATGTSLLALGIVPVVIDGAATGALYFGFSRERRIDGDERTYLENLAALAAETLRRSRLHAQLIDALEVRQAMIQASPAAIMLLDDRGHVQSWNAAAERIFGYREDEVLGRFLPTVPEELREPYLANLRAVVEEGRVVAGAETVRVDRHGNRVDVALYGAPVRRAGGATMSLGMVVDVSERKRIDRGRQLVADVGQALSRSLDWEDTLRQAVSLPVPAFADWCAVHALRDGQLHCLAMTGVTDLGQIPPMAHDPARPGLSMALATGAAQVMRDLDDDDLRGIARDEAHLARLRATGMRSFMSVPMRVGGQLVGGFSFGSCTRNYDALDLTVADALAGQAAAAIENARLFREATAARASAEAASQAKDQFLAMLGHELRNPLAPIRTALELMALDEGTPSRSRAVLERQVGHLTRLVDDLLDVSRITRGKIEIVRTELDFADVVARAVEQTSPLFEQRGHALAVDAATGLVVHGDAVRLAQVVANLLTNAARYTSPGGAIAVRAHREGGEIVLVVSDNGVGMAPETVPAIFDMFVQGPQGIARTEGGLGLGLTIVRSLVELHGGSVAARSAGLGAGSEFEVRLPVAARTAVEPARRVTPREATPPARRRRVLVVDDNEDAARLLAQLLEARGHEVGVAFDGPEALRVASELRPEVAILDLGLPVMDGFELAERLLRDPLHRSLRLVALSGYSQPNDRVRTRAVGFHHHLAKPASVQALFEAIEAP